ncbi:GPW/gp25 family protein [Desulfobulbus sp.]|uniref:GPW/gp25 family protein n=1 Tax=Desulfobulbus sp. TaxID=895 RepID=UPI00286EC8C3|nr:GPW/gp25 family protein [Desulfobulbus sp.]
MSDHTTQPLQTSFLGTGWSFPPEFVQATGSVRMTADEEDIRASLIVLLGTAAGERFLAPDYGIDMHELLFESLSTTMRTYLKDRVRTAILIHEPRIDLLGLELETAGQLDGRLGIVVDYEVRATNSRYNLVYPFYLSDGNEARRTVAVE